MLQARCTPVHECRALQCCRHPVCLGILLYEHAVLAGLAPARRVGREARVCLRSGAPCGRTQALKGVLRPTNPGAHSPPGLARQHRHCAASGWRFKPEYSASLRIV